MDQMQRNGWDNSSNPAMVVVYVIMAILLAIVAIVGWVVL